MMKWEKVVAEGKSDAIAVCCTCILQNLWFLLLFACKSLSVLFCVVLLRFRLAYSIMFTEPSRLICIRVFDFYLLPDSSRLLLYVLEYFYITRILAPILLVA
jgi:hypothetical protein